MIVPQGAHNLSDGTLATPQPQEVIHGGPSCANPSKQECEQGANAALFAGEKFRITCRVEEKRASK